MSQQLWFWLGTVPLTIQSFTSQIAVLTTEITAIVIVLAALSFAIGVALMSNPVISIIPSLSETGARIKIDSIKALFTISIYGGVVNLVVWVAHLLNSIG